MLCGAVEAVGEGEECGIRVGGQGWVLGVLAGEEADWWWSDRVREEGWQK